MYEKILAELRKKYAGLPTKVLERLAKQIAEGGTVTEDAQIEGAVSNLTISPTDLANYIQQESDRRVDAAVKKAVKKALDEHAANNGGGDDDTDDDVDDEPETRPKGKPKKSGREDHNPVLAEIRKLNAKIEKLEQKEETGKLQKKLNERLTEKKIPLFMARGATITKEDDLDDIVAGIEKDWTAAQNELSASGFSSKANPGGSSLTNPTAVDDAAAQAAIKGWSSEKKKQNGHTAATVK